MSWQVGAAMSGVIAVAYLAISATIAVGLARTRQLTTNVLGLATMTIFFTCSVGHGLHGLHLIEPSIGLDSPEAQAMRDAWHWHLTVWDGFTAVVAVLYLSLRRSYGRLLQTPAMFDDEVARAGRVIVDRIAEAVLVLDPDGRTVHANPGAEQALAGLRGTGAEPPASGDWRAVRPDGTRVVAAELPAERTRLTGEPCTDVELGLETLEGDRRWLRFSTRRRDDGTDLPCAVVASFTDVTERFRAEEALARSDRRHAAVVSSLHEGVLQHDVTGRIVAVNPRAAELLQRPASHLLGRGPHEPSWTAVRPDGSVLPAAEHPAMRALATGAACTGELLGIRTPLGELRWLEVNASPLPHGGVVSSFVDVTERRRRERLLAEAEQRLRTSFEQAPIGMALTELDGTILQVNTAFAELVGIPRDALTGRTFRDELVHPADRAPAAEALRRLQDGVASVRLEERLLHAVGHEVWVQVDCALLRDADGAPQAVLRQVQDVTERRGHEAQLRHLADHDALTGLLNRRGFNRELERHVELSERYGARGALLVLDLDHFKYVNDTLGHKSGDELIVATGDLLRARMRRTDVVARLGGDEFAILLPHGGIADAEAVARALLEDLRMRRTGPTAVGVRITASIGIAAVRGDEPSADALLVDADLAMYEAKEAGRDRWARSVPEGHHQPKVKARMTWIERIGEALEHDGFTLLAQPIVDLADGGTRAHELLLRMNGAQGDLIPPATFLYIAERFDLVQHIDRWVLGQATQVAAQLRREGKPSALTVNVSGKSFGDLDLLEHLRRSIDDAGTDPADLVVEITETAAVSQVHQARAFAQGLRELGVRLAIDDFGAGFGSFYYLKHLPFDLLKVDGEFVSHLLTSRPDELIVRAVRDLAHGMGREVVAEHCSSAAIEQRLREEGIDLAQGFHLGRPAPVADLLGAPLPGRPGAPAVRR